MSSGEFQLGEFLSSGVQRLVARAIVIAKDDRRESRFFADFLVSSAAASFKRSIHAKNGENIPPFLIAAISGSCNLHCEGCVLFQKKEEVEKML